MTHHEKQRLFINVEEWGGVNRYITWQLDILPMIWQYYDFSKLEERFIMLVCMQYDNAHESGRDPIKLSYTDIAKIINCSVEGAKKAVGMVLDSKLILIKDTRKGRAKTQYLPNVPYIHKQLKKYLKLS